MTILPDDWNPGNKMRIKIGDDGITWYYFTLVRLLTAACPDSYSEIRQWCLDNIGDSKWYIVNLNWYFRNKEDAVLFDLRWNYNDTNT